MSTHCFTPEVEMEDCLELQKHFYPCYRFLFVCSIKLGQKLTVCQIFFFLCFEMPKISNYICFCCCNVWLCYEFFAFFICLMSLVRYFFFVRGYKIYKCFSLGLSVQRTDQNAKCNAQLPRLKCLIVYHE